MKSFAPRVTLFWNKMLNFRFRCSKALEEIPMTRHFMSRFFAGILLGSLVVATPMAAQTDPEPDVPKAARALMDALLEFFGEELRGLSAELPNLLLYDPPEMLPNGDIIIRRRPEPLSPPGDGEIDL